MRWLLIALLLVACADDDAPTSEDVRCEQGPMLLQDAWNALAARSLACTRDEDCVVADLGVHCEGFDYDSCGWPLTRDAASQWDAGAMCQQIEKLPSAGLSCFSSPSCKSVTPACIDMKCSAR